MWYLLWHDWHDDAQQFQFGCIVFSEMHNDTCDHVAQQSHHCKVVLDKAELGHDARAEPQHSAPLWIAVGDNSVIEQRGEVGGDLALVQRYGQYLRHGRNYLDAQFMQFDAAWRLRHLDGFALDGDHAFHA